MIDSLYNNKKIKGYINLSTCLRVEYYLELDSSYSIEMLRKDLNIDGLFFKSGNEGLNYLFRVVCGFESIIKGEDQILSQIKKSYSIAFEKKHVTSNLNVIFNKAIELGKKFRNRSKIAHNALSLEAISLKFIKSRVDNLEDKSILILGLGDLAIDVMELLKKEKVAR